MNLLALIGGKAKSSPDDMGGMSGDSGGDDSSNDKPERMYAREAFQAVKDDDEAGFVEAFLGAVKACSQSYSEPDNDEPA
jgi:hypothetical protein